MLTHRVNCCSISRFNQICCCFQYRYWHFGNAGHSSSLEHGLAHAMSEEPNHALQYSWHLRQHWWHMQLSDGDTWNKWMWYRLCSVSPMQAQGVQLSPQEAWIWHAQNLKQPSQYSRWNTKSRWNILAEALRCTQPLHFTRCISLHCIQISNQSYLTLIIISTSSFASNKCCS